MTTAARLSKPILVRLDLLVLAGYSILTLIFTYPLVLHLGAHVLGNPADNLEYVWKMWWVPHALFERGISPFFHPDVYVPSGYPMANGELTPTHTFFMLPLTLIAGPTLAYNVAGLASTILSGWVVYRLALRVLARLGEVNAATAHLSAFFAGAAFALSPYRFTRLAAQLPLIGTGWLALALLGLDRWFETRHPRDAALAAIGASLATLSSWYYGYMLALLLPVYLIALAGRDLPALLRDRRTWISAGLGLALTAVIVGPFLAPYLMQYGAGEALVPLTSASIWAASPLDYLLPNIRHPLWGEQVRQALWPTPGDWLFEFAISPGWAVLLFGLWGWSRVRGSHWRALKWVMGVAFVLSLGPICWWGACRSLCRCRRWRCARSCPARTRSAPGRASRSWSRSA